MRVREPKTLRLAQNIRGDRLNIEPLQFALGLHNFLYLAQKPGIDSGCLREHLDAVPGLKSKEQVPQSFGMGNGQATL